MSQCEQCKASLDNMYSADAENWDWFTGYFDRTVYFCGKHKDSKMRNEVFRLSREVPDHFYDTPRSYRQAGLYETDSVIKKARSAGKENE